MALFKVIEYLENGPFFRLYREDGSEVPLMLGMAEEDEYGQYFPLTAELEQGEYWLIEDDQQLLVISTVTLQGSEIIRKPIIRFTFNEETFVSALHTQMLISQMPPEVATAIAQYCRER